MGARFTPVLAEELRRRRRGKVGRSWYVDETYLKVGGCWCYLYRAIDKAGALLDVLFSQHRDMEAVKRLLLRAGTGALVNAKAASRCLTLDACPVTAS